MKITVIKPVIEPGGFPVVINLEPHEATLLREFFSHTSRSKAAELIGESVTSNKIQDLDELLYNLYENLHAEGY